MHLSSLSNVDLLSLASNNSALNAFGLRRALRNQSINQPIISPRARINHHELMDEALFASIASLTNTKWAHIWDLRNPLQFFDFGRFNPFL